MMLPRSRHLVPLACRHLLPQHAAAYLDAAAPEGVTALTTGLEPLHSSPRQAPSRTHSTISSKVLLDDKVSDENEPSSSGSARTPLGFAPPSFGCRGFASLPSPRLADSSPLPPDPFSLVRQEIESVTERLRRCIMTDIPVLEAAAEYFFRAGQEGKRLRSSIILLMSTALAAGPISPAYLVVDESPASTHPPEQRRRQQRIAEITELIHVASLLHDDVIDNADSRRGLKALNSLFGNKVAILAGDFLLARASVSLAALRNSEVIALMSQVLEHLVAGEILQMTTSPDDALSMDHYLRKTFFKTASLMANSCKSVAVLAGCSPAEATAAWEYGRHLGLSFQLIDDVLDFTATAEELGKPVGSDLRAGLTTAPVLFALRQFPELMPMAKRRYSEPGDVEHALDLVRQSSGVDQARDLAAAHARDAAAALDRLPPASGEAALASRAALETITRKVLTRRK